MTKFKLVFLLLAIDNLEKAFVAIENDPSNDNIIKTIKAWREFKDVWKS